MTKVFISYCHKQGEWVWDRLVPVLKAGAIEGLIDRERFEAGKAIEGKMDTTQDQADRHILVTEAAGWPHLVQLIAETAVDVVNQSPAEHVTPELMEQTLDKAIVRGDAVLRLLMQTESELPGEWEYLLGFRRHDTQPPPDDEAIYTSLRRRLLVTEEANDWRLRVPLMHRWLTQRW